MSTNTNNLPETTSCTAIVSGKVQGVGYRNFAYSQARLCKVMGWVRNRTDGGVEIYGEGTKENLNEFLAALKQGPKLSKISDIVVTWVSIEQPTCTEFSVKKS